MALPPCHAFFQFYVADGRLSCQLYQRSADLFLGVPFNIASYALLTHMMAAQAGLAVGEFVWTGGDCHIYDNHVEQVELYSSTREPRPYPKLALGQRDSIFDYTYDDVVVENYDPHPPIKAPVACMTPMPEVGLVWAQSTSGVIGRGGDIPWRVPEDLSHFKRGHHGSHRRHGPAAPGNHCHPPSGRCPDGGNLVLSRQANFVANRAEVVGSLAQALTGADTWVIGGGGDLRAGVAAGHPL